MEADNEEVKNHTKIEQRIVLEGTTKTIYTIAYDEICERFRNEVEGVNISARTFECADFDKVTHDRLISRCREVFGGVPSNIGRDKAKKKALEFDKNYVKEAGQNFEVVYEIKIVEHEEIFQDTPEDSELWSRVTGLSLSINGAGTNPLIDHPKNEGFGPTIGDKHAQNWQVGTRGLISDNNENNEQKQIPADQTPVHNSHGGQEHNENISNNEEYNGDTHNDKSDDTNEERDTSESKLVPKTPEVSHDQEEGNGDSGSR